MSTAAPAAPSLSALAAEAQPTPGTATDITAPAATQQNLVRSAKPIPDLPGVFSDDDPFPAPPSKPATPGTAQRGPDGRFLATGTSPVSAGPGEHALEAATQPDPAKPATTKFKFAGEEFDSSEAAEQNFKSLRGQFRPVQALARSLGGIDKIVPQFTGAAESARGWHAKAQELEAELATYRNGSAPASTEAAQPDAPAEGIDWGMYAEIEKLADAQGEPWKARQWLSEEQDKIVQARVQRILDERLAPLADAEKHQAVIDQTTNLFDNLAGYTNSDGSISFPELHDEAASYEVGKIWASLGFDPKLPQGAIAAIAIYRMSKANTSRSQAGPLAAAPQPAALIPAPPTDARAAADLGDGRVRELRAPDAGSPSADAARILSGLRQANSGSRALLGFDA